MREYWRSFKEIISWELCIFSYLNLNRGFSAKVPCKLFLAGADKDPQISARLGESIR